jgi:hypothetical protein
MSLSLSDRVKNAFSVLLPGSFAGVIANSMCHPLDSVKTRVLQVDSNVRTFFSFWVLSHFCAGKLLLFRVISLLLSFFNVLSETIMIAKHHGCWKFGQLFFFQFFSVRVANGFSAEGNDSAYLFCRETESILVYSMLLVPSRKVKDSSLYIEDTALVRILVDFSFTDICPRQRL